MSRKNEKKERKKEYVFGKKERKKLIERRRNKLKMFGKKERKKILSFFPIGKFQEKSTMNCLQTKK